MRLIDADSLKEELMDLNAGSGNVCAILTTIICSIIDDRPEAVVRCKDCAYWNRNDYIPGRDIARCDWFSILEEESNKKFEYTDADDFCSNGEREDKS